MVSVPAPRMSAPKVFREVGQVHNVGLPGGVLNDGQAPGLSPPPSMMFMVAPTVTTSR